MLFQPLSQNPTPNPVRLSAKLNEPAVNVKQNQPLPLGAAAWYNSHNGKPVKLKIYENEICLEFSFNDIRKNRPPNRSQTRINHFSRKSRMRVLRKFNQLQTKTLGEGIFITCTAKNSLMSIEEFEYTFLKIFLPKLKKIIPNLVYCWRLEFHQSGFPHYHMFAWSSEKKRKLRSDFYKRKIRETWRSAINDNSVAAQKYACKIIRINNRRKAFSYLSKYIAKEDNIENANKPGRRWAVSANFPASPITEVIIRKPAADRLLLAVQNMMKENGRDPENVDKYINDEGQTFAWFHISEIIKLLAQANICAQIPLLEMYNRTGELTLDPAYFNDYPALQLSA